MIDIVRNYLQLWAIQLVPALLPYMIITTFILELSNRYLSINAKCNISKTIYSFPLSLTALFILLAGHLCGYPIGAKLISDAYNNKNLTLEESNFLNAVCNQASPAFLNFYVGKYILNGIIPSSSIYIVFYTSTIITIVLMGSIYLSHKKIQHEDVIKSSHNADFSIMQLLDNIISSCCITILKIGGYIILFSLINEFILQLFPDSCTFLKVLFSSLEITSGLSLIKSCDIPNTLLVPAVLSITAFGGFCTMAQIKGMLSRTSLSIIPYIIGKIFYMIIVFIISLLFIKIKVFSFNV